MKNRMLSNLILCGLFIFSLNTFAEDSTNPAKELLEKKEYIKYYNKATDVLERLGQIAIEGQTPTVESVSYKGLSDSSGNVTDEAAESTSENLFGVEVDSKLTDAFNNDFKSVIAEVISKVVPDEFGGITSEGVAYLCGLLTAESAEAIASSFDIVANFIIFIVMVDPGLFEPSNSSYSSDFQLTTNLTNNNSEYPLIIEHFNINASNNSKDKSSTKKYLYASSNLATGHISKTAHKCSFKVEAGDPAVFKPAVIPILVRPLINNVALPASMITQMFGYSCSFLSGNDSSTYEWDILAFGGLNPDNQINFVTSQWHYPKPQPNAVNDPKFYPDLSSSIDNEVSIISWISDNLTKSPTMELDYGIDVVETNSYMWQLTFQNNDPNYVYKYSVYTENSPKLDTLSGVGLFTPNFYTQADSSFPPNCFEFEIVPLNNVGYTSPKIPINEYGIINLGWATTETLTVNNDVNTFYITFTAYNQGDTGILEEYGSFVLPLKIITKKTGGFIGIGQTVQPFIEPQPIQGGTITNQPPWDPTKTLTNQNAIIGKSKNNTSVQGLNIEDYTSEQSYKNNPINIILNSSTIENGSSSSGSL